MAINPHEDKSTLIGIVVDRNDPNNLGGHKVFCPQIHGKDTKIEHLPWIRYQMPPGASGAASNQGSLDHGQMVIVKRDGGEAGSGFGTIVGVLQTKRKSNPNMPGNISLINAYKQISDALEYESPINIRPDIEESYENGARVRKIKEKGKKHKHSLLNGMMSHGAAYPTNATILPQLTNISGASTSNIGGMSADILDMMPGINLGGLSDILNLLPPTLQDQIFGSMPSDVVDQLLNTTALTSSVSTIPVDGMMSGTRVDPTALLLALPDLLSGINTPGGLDYALSNITSNLSSLGSVGSSLISMTVSTPFGDIFQQIDPATGEISSVIPDSVAQSQQAFGSMLSSLPSAGGADLFGDSSQLMSDMSQRLSDPAMTNKFKQVMEQNVSTTKGTDARKALNESGGKVNSAVKGAKGFFGG